MIVLYDMEEVDGVALINKGVGGAALDGVLGAYVDGATGARLDARFRRADTFRRRGRGGRPRLRDVAIFRGDKSRFVRYAIPEGGCLEDAAKVTAPARAQEGVVASANDAAPVLHDEYHAISVVENGAQEFYVYASDPDGDWLDIDVTSLPLHGELECFDSFHSKTKEVVLAVPYVLAARDLSEEVDRGGRPRPRRRG